MSEPSGGATSLLVSQYEAADEAAVVALWTDVFPDNPPHSEPLKVIRQKMAFQPELFFVAKLGGSLVGTIMAGYDGHRGWMYAVAVAPAHQRHGIGRRLLRRAEDALSALGCTKVNLQVRATNQQVVEFYRMAGYLVEDRVSLGKRLQ